MERKWRRERERRRLNENKQRTLKHVTSWMACGWSERARCDTLGHNVVCAQSESVREKLSCELYLSTPHRRLQWIAIDCERNQL